MTPDEMSLNPFTDAPYTYFNLVKRYQEGGFNYYYFKVWFTIVMLTGEPSGPWRQVK